MRWRCKYHGELPSDEVRPHLTIEGDYTIRCASCHREVEEVDPPRFWCPACEWEGWDPEVEIVEDDVVNTCPECGTEVEH